MNDTALFYRLKQEILEKYKERFPYYSGSITQFGTQEIAALLGLIEEECNERVSEKWVYTHLKPEVNERLPRKDMLNIFCRWLGYEGWDEFVYLRKDTEYAAPPPLPEMKTRTKNRIMLYTGIGITAVVVTIAIAFWGMDHEVSVCLKDKYTQKEIEHGKVTVHVLENGSKVKARPNGSCYTVKINENRAVLVAESPYYKTDTLKIAVDSGAATFEFDLQPDDYAMMLRAYMNADVDDWNRRKAQLAAIISDDAVIQEIMFDDIGVEFLDKEEFINKVTTPSKSVRTMEVVAIEYRGDKIISLKYLQKQ